ncbi:hypothetical protein CARUB_v10027398mg [Capsella rubella]|uniref:Uncharacterized protein n=1 Tax=Capsella rubella TaxID=81985 RepID=R0GC58_9BRAS|nr:elicitor peptide 2 [Capsella rubella]EOA14244.1 hypothetical protein CARUB_v10027398mg [Capsella rubella]
MDKLVSQREEETYLRIPFQFLDQTVIAIFKCLGLLCPTAKRPASSPVTLNQPEPEDQEYDVDMKDDEDVVLLTRGGGRKKTRGKQTDKEKTSKGRRGQTNKIPKAAAAIQVSGD